MDVTHCYTVQMMITRIVMTLQIVRSVFKHRNKVQKKTNRATEITRKKKKIEWKYEIILIIFICKFWEFFLDDFLFEFMHDQYNVYTLYWIAISASFNRNHYFSSFLNELQKKKYRTDFYRLYAYRKALSWIIPIWICIDLLFTAHKKMHS